MTNGESAAGTLREVKPGETVLSWNDVLHEGPTPPSLTLQQMSVVRSRFLSDCGFGDYNKILAEMTERDRTLLQAAEITLWFEHDLYDQLQLIQILHALRGAGKPVALINPAEYLGPMQPEQLAALWPGRRAVTQGEYDLAARAWDAFCAGSAETLRTFLQQDTRALPYLQAALRRQLEDMPEPGAISRTDRQILDAASAHPASFHDLYRLTQQKEDPIYMGDSIVEMHMQRLAAGPDPLIILDPIALTPSGRRLLEAGAIE